MKRMITVTVTLHGWLRKYFPEGETRVMRIAENSAAKDVIKLIDVPAGMAVIAVNGEKEGSSEQALQDGDVISLYPIVFGG